MRQADEGEIPSSSVSASPARSSLGGILPCESLLALFSRSGAVPLATVDAIFEASLIDRPLSTQEESVQEFEDDRTTWDVSQISIWKDSCRAM